MIAAAASIDCARRYAQTVDTTNQEILLMSVSSVLMRLGRSLGLLILLMALLFFLVFAISPGLELFPNGLDWAVAILMGILSLVWLGAGRGPKRTEETD
jgi:multisubunit Na+/H+ antiporter MnhB subunit